MPGTINETPPVAVVISPWLPTSHQPYAGSFVTEFIRCAHEVYGSVSAVHVDDSIRSAKPRLHQLIANDLTRRRIAAIRPGSTGIRVHLPLLVRRGSGWRERVEQAVKAGRALGHLVEGLSDSGFGSLPAHVHGHVGLIAGAVALPWIDDHHLHLYEHGSFLLNALDDPGTSHVYARAVAAARTISAVNPTMAERLAERFPAAQSKIETFPNAIDFSRFPFTDPAPTLRRWMYVGNVKLDKGIDRLLQAFRLARAKYEDVSLTIVGDGPDREVIRSSDLKDHIEVKRSVAPNEVPGLYQSADLLVHLSYHETFGMTAIEAIASGLPVLLASTDGFRFTLGETIDQAGTMLTQDVSPKGVVEAYAELRDVPSRLDLRSVRESLIVRFSSEAIARRLALRAGMTFGELEMVDHAWP